MICPKCGHKSNPAAELAKLSHQKGRATSEVMREVARKRWDKTKK
jgi:hypothetical protein